MPSYAHLNSGGPQSQSTAESNGGSQQENRPSGNYYEDINNPNNYIPMENQYPIGYGAIRAVKPESNINLLTDQALLEQKRDKCIEIFKTSTLVHDIITKARYDPTFSNKHR